jgi:hypothetical protein
MTEAIFYSLIITPLPAENQSPQKVVFDKTEALA